MRTTILTIPDFAGSRIVGYEEELSDAECCAQGIHEADKSGYYFSDNEILENCKHCGEFFVEKDCTEMYNEPCEDHFDNQEEKNKWIDSLKLKSTAWHKDGYRFITREEMV